MTIRTAPTALSDDTLGCVTGGTGTAGNDTLLGSADAGDRLVGLGGDDIMVGYGGEDTMFGGEGNDLMAAMNDDDIALGGAGDDIVDGGRGDDLIAGEAGNDTLAGGTGSDTAFGGDGDDLYVWATNHSGDDRFYGDGGTNAIEVVVILSDDEGGGTSDQVRNTLEGQTFTVESETSWEMVDGQVIFDGPANGSFTMNGRTITFTEVSVIKAADLG